MYLTGWKHYLCARFTLYVCVCVCACMSIIYIHKLLPSYTTHRNWKSELWTHWMFDCSLFSTWQRMFMVNIDTHDINKYIVPITDSIKYKWRWLQLLIWPLFWPVVLMGTMYVTLWFRFLSQFERRLLFISFKNYLNSSDEHAAFTWTVFFFIK